MSLDEQSCPIRKLTPPGEHDGPDLEWVPDAGGGRWIARSYETVRQILRDEGGFHQAGFGADRVRMNPRMRPPILYLDGAEHRRQRSAAARLFAPKVTEDYRPMISALTDRLVTRVRSDRAVDLSQLSLRLAVGVAAEVVGLTNSSLPAMTRRLETFFSHDDDLDAPPRGLVPRWQWLRSRTAILRFHLFDVRPAIRARRRKRQSDVISQTIDSGFSDAEILTECITYGAAGMVTTREFITVAAWHLISHPELLARFRGADVEGRRALLAEALRVEPVVGHLYRRAVRDVELTGPDGPVMVRSGQRIDLMIRDANSDRTVVGSEELLLCPGRRLPRGVPATVASFGDGAHRCPGGPLAIMESEIFLSALFTRDIEMVSAPQVRWNSVTQGYDLDRMMIKLAA